MSAITFDTLKFAERLEKAGMSREQAAAIVETQKEALAETLDGTLATKGDIALMRTDLIALRGDMKEEVAAVRGELTSVKWMMGVLVALSVANFAKQFF